MTSRQFWQSASNWGLIGGSALFVMNIIGWALKLEMASTWLYELLLFAVICPLIIYTAKRNVKNAGPEGYSYGRAVGYVFAMMLFAGIVYGVGRFLLVNFIAHDYYEVLNTSKLDAAFAVYSKMPQYEQMLEMRGQMVQMLTNPFVLILSGIWEMVTKGGFLGLILCVFLYKKPDMFATPPVSQSQTEGDESGS